MLWNPTDHQVTVIDHNNAFDLTFDEAKFFQNHVFYKERDQIPASFLLEQKQVFEKMTDRFAEVTKGFPEEWTERDELPGDFVPETVCEILNRVDRLSEVFGGQA